MKKILLPLLAIFLMTSAGVLAQSTTEKIEQKTEEAVTATEATVKKAAKETGEAVETAAEKTGTAVKKAADTTAKTTKKAGKDVTDSDIYKKIETELGKPFSPEQKQKYADAWKAAQEKTRAAEKEFSDKISEITGIGKKKTNKIVSDNGL